MASDFTGPMILLIGAGVALFGYQQGWFGQGGGGGEAAAEEMGGETAPSTQNRCWTVNPSSGQKACACAGKQYFLMGAARTCTDCSKHCHGKSVPTIKSSSPKPFTTSAKGSPAIRAKINAAVNAPKKPLQSTLCKCGSATATHVIGDCLRCRQSCRSRCGNCSPQCMGTRSNLATDYGDISPALMGREDNYSEPLYFSGVGAVKFPKTYGVTMSLPAVGQQAGPW